MARWTVRAKWGCRLPMRGAVRVAAEFRLPRPQRPKSVYPVTRPDADKLARAAGDVISGICFNDDAAIVEWAIRKRYCSVEEGPGVHLVVVEV